MILPKVYWKYVFRKKGEYIDYESKYTTSNIGNIDLKEGNVVTKTLI